MNYAVTHQLPEARGAVVAALGDITISPPVVSIARDSVVAFPFTPGETDTSVLLYND